MSDDAIILEGDSIREGHLLKVYNQDRKKFSNADKVYYAMWTENSLGVEQPIMMTATELDRFTNRAKTMYLENLNLPKGHIARILNHDVLFGYDTHNDKISFVMTPRELAICFNRAIKNVEDIPQKSFFTDLTD